MLDWGRQGILCLLITVVLLVAILCCVLSSILIVQLPINSVSFLIHPSLTPPSRIHTHISAQVVTPFPDRPIDGLFTITTELSPMLSPSIESSSRPTETETLLSRLLEKTIRRSGALDTESLCLIASSKVWSIRADVHILSHDGNLTDAACIGVIAALQHFRKPDTETRGEEVVVYSAAEREPVKLSLLHFPLCVTFSFYGEGLLGKDGEGEKEKMLLDAGLLEEQLREGSVTIGMKRHGEVCQIAKLGGLPVHALTMW